MPGEAVLVLCRWAIGLAFMASAIGKAASITSFRNAIVDFEVVPMRLTGMVAVTILGAEGLVVLLIAAGGTGVAGGFALALALLTAFSATLTVALRKKSDISCNCFGPGQRQVSWYDVARNGTLGLCCAGGLWGQLASSGGNLATAVILVLGLAASALVILAANLEDITEFLRKPYLYE